MRTYGIDQSTGNWTLLTQAPVVGPSNPMTYTIGGVTGAGSYIVSTLYTVLFSFVDSSITVNAGDIILNDQLYTANGELVSSTWTDLDLNVLLNTAPASVNLNILPTGEQGLYTAYDLSQGEVAIVDSGYIWLATLAQTLRLNQGESPFYANYGVPAQQSVISQIAPTTAVNRTQAQFSQYFSTLTVIRDPNATEPTYNVNATFLNGTTIQSVIAT